MREKVSVALPDGTEQPLEGTTSIGRFLDNDLVVASTTVSRHHARLIRGEGGRWFVEDRGSRNGTFLNRTRIQPGVPLPLHHSDRIGIGSETIVFSWIPDTADPEATDPLVAAPPPTRPLSPFQAQVVRCLCTGWLEGGSLDRLPSNEEIASQLGTAGASESVKAALRRAYAKAGLSAGTPHAKRRALCRIARQRGWI